MTDTKTRSRFEGVPSDTVRANLAAAFSYLGTTIIPQPHTVVTPSSNMVQFTLKVPDDYKEIPTLTLVELLHLGLHSTSSTFDDSGKHLRLMFDLQYVPCDHKTDALDADLRDRIARVLPTVVPIQRLGEVAPIVFRTLGGPHYHTTSELMPYTALRNALYHRIPVGEEAEACRVIANWALAHVAHDGYLMHMCEDLFRTLNRMLGQLGSPYILERVRMPCNDPVFKTVSLVRPTIRK